MAFTDPTYIELQFVSDETNPTGEIDSPGPPGPFDTPPGNHSEVFGVGIGTVLDLETVIDTDEPLPPSGIEDVDWTDAIEPPGGWPPAQWVYGVSILPDHVQVNLETVSTFYPFGDVLGVTVYQRRPTTFFRLQADGGGRRVMYAAYGDDSPRRFFELWKDGVRFSFLGLPDPYVQLRSPSGVITQRTVEMRGRAYGRFGVDLGELNELGDWKMQVRFVEESDSLGAPVADPDSDIPEPPPPPGELWRALHHPIILKVSAGAEEIW